jgi:hypothetical protein
MPETGAISGGVCHARSQRRGQSVACESYEICSFVYTRRSKVITVVQLAVTIRARSGADSRTKLLAPARGFSAVRKIHRFAVNSFDDEIDEIQVIRTSTHAVVL